MPGGGKIPYVIAYREIVEDSNSRETYEPLRCKLERSDFARFLWLAFSTWYVDQRGMGIGGVDLEQKPQICALPLDLRITKHFAGKACRFRCAHWTVKTIAMT